MNNNLEQKLEQQRIAVQQTESQLEQQRALQAQLQVIEQQNSTEYQLKQVAQAQIDGIELDIAQYASQGIQKAENIIDLLAQKQTIQKKIDKAQQERLEFCILVYRQLLETHKLKSKLDSKLPFNQFKVSIEFTEKFPSLFSGTPIELQNFMRDNQRNSVSIIAKWKNKN